MMKRAALVLIALSMIPTLIGGDGNPVTAQTVSYCLPISISGASGRSVCENNWVANWTWTAPNAGSFTFDTKGSDFDLLLSVDAVYRGVLEDVLQEVATNVNADRTSPGSVNFNTQRGQEYEIYAWRTNDSVDPGTIVLNWRPSSANGVSRVKNDAFDSSEAISGVSGWSTGSNVGADMESGEPNHAGGVGGASVWWTWTAHATEPVIFDTRGSDFDTLLAIYTGNVLNNLALAASNDDTAVGGLVFYQSTVRLNAQLGQTYRIAVDGYRGATGSILLNWRPESDSGKSDVMLNLSEITLDTSQGQTISVNYSGPTFDEEELMVWVGDTPVESVFVNSQIHLILPLTQMGETLLEFDFGGFSASLPIDIAEAPAIVDPTSYISGVVDDLVAELDSLPEDDWHDEIDALIAVERELSHLSAHEIRETAIFLKQNLEPLSAQSYESYSTATTPSYEDETCHGKVYNFLRDAHTSNEVETKLLLLLSKGYVWEAVFTYIHYLRNVDNIENSVEFMKSTCTDSTARVTSTDGSTIIPANVSDAYPIETDVQWAEQWNEAINDASKSQFSTRLRSFGGRLSKVTAKVSNFVDGIRLRPIFSRLPILDKMVGKLGARSSRFAEHEKLGSFQLIDAEDYIFDVDSVSNPNIDVAIVADMAEKVLWEFRVKDRRLMPEEGSVDFSVELNIISKEDTTKDVTTTVQFQLSANRGATIAITANSISVTEGMPATFTVTFDPPPASVVGLFYTVIQTGAFVAPTALGSKVLLVDESEGMVTITVPTENDEFGEEAGTVSVGLTKVGFRDAGEYTTRDVVGSAEVMVFDDDGPSEPDVSIAAESSAVTAGSDAFFRITLDPAPSSGITLRSTTVWQGRDGSSTSRTHEHTVSEDVVILDLRVRTRDKDAAVTIEIESGMGYAVGTPATAEVKVKSGGAGDGTRDDDSGDDDSGDDDSGDDDSGDDDSQDDDTPMQPDHLLCAAFVPVNDGTSTYSFNHWQVDQFLRLRYSKGIYVYNESQLDLGVTIRFAGPNCRLCRGGRVSVPTPGGSLTVDCADYGDTINEALRDKYQTPIPTIRISCSIPSQEILAMCRAL